MKRVLWFVITIAVATFFTWQFCSETKVNQDLRTHYRFAKPDRDNMGRTEGLDAFLRRTGSTKTSEVYLPKVEAAFYDLNPGYKGPLEAGRDYKVPSLP
jgi:hypothetical protein